MNASAVTRLSHTANSPQQDSVNNSLSAHTRGAARRGYAVIGVFAAMMVLWSALAPLASVAIAPGTVSPDGARRVVQHLEGGMISALLVKEGDHVTEGQTLLRLDDTGADAVNTNLVNQINAARAAEARYQAEIADTNEVTFPSDLIEAAKNSTAAADSIAAENALFAVRRQRFDKQTEILNARVRQIDEQIIGLQSEEASLRRQIELVRERLIALEELFAKGLVTKPVVVELRARLASLDGEIGKNSAAIARARQAAGETNLEIESLGVTRLDEATSGLRMMRAEIAELVERHRATDDALRRTTIHAPATGRIVDLRYKTVGGVVGRGEKILEIVPDSELLVIEAHIQPRDIDDVAEGMKAQIVFPGYNDQRNAPHIEGAVRMVAADVTAEPRSGVPIYVVKVEVPADERAKLPANLRLIAGMPAEVFIETGSRTVWGYLFDPIIDTFSRAGRER